jgi:drug/metabolite transporter (DMT)-like permease
MKNKDLLAYGAALGAAFFWSFSFVWFKIAYLAYNPITVVLFRLVISAILIIVIGWSMKRLQKPSKKDVGLFFLMSFFEPFLYFMGESYGLKYVSSTVAAVIVATIPLLTPIFAWYFYREQVRLMNIVGFFFSFIGVGMVVLDQSGHFEASPLGVGLEFIAVFAAIAYSIVLKNVASRYNTFTIIAYQNLIGIALFLPVWLFVDFKDFLNTPFHPQAFRAIVLLAVFSSTLAFVFFTQSVRQLGMNRANTFINLIPVFVAVTSFFVLNESMDLQKITGIIIVIAGLSLAQAKRRHRKGQKAIEIHRK